MSQPYEYLDQASIDKLLNMPRRDTPVGARDYTAMLLMYHHGLRVSEACNLTWNDVTLDGYLKIRNTKGYAGKKKGRNLPASSALLLCLSEATRYSQRVLATPRAPKTSERLLRAQVDRYARAAGLGPIHPHLLRHTFAVEMLDKGMLLPELQLALGHSQLTSTAVYLHSRPERLAGFMRDR